MQFVLMSICYLMVETQRLWTGVSCLMEDSCPGNTLGMEEDLLFLPFKKSISSKTEVLLTLSGWMKWRKLLIDSPGISEAVVPVGLQFMDSRAQRTS